MAAELAMVPVVLPQELPVCSCPQLGWWPELLPLGPVRPPPLGRDLILLRECRREVLHLYELANKCLRPIAVAIVQQVARTSGQLGTNETDSGQANDVLTLVGIPEHLACLGQFSRV